MVKPVNKTLRIAAMSAGEEIGHVSGPVVTFRGNGDSLRSLLVNIEPVQEGSGDPSPYNVRPISGWSECNVWVQPTHDTTANPTATLQLGQTVYGGTLDVTNGVLTVDMAMVDLGTLGWQYDSVSVPSHPFFRAIPLGMAWNTDLYICSNYPNSNQHQSIVYVPDMSTMTYNKEFRVRDSRYTDATTFQTAMSGVQLVYPLATPITIPLTPTEISTLLGANNLWADTGDSDVEYIATGGEGGKLALLLRNRKELLIAMRKGLTPAEAGLLSSTPLLGGFVRPGLSTDDEKEEDDLI